MKNKKIFLWGGIFILIIGAFYFINVIKNNVSNLNTNSDNGQKVVVYKSPDCGCCDVYVRYLKKKGYNVEVINKTNLDAIKSKFGVPSDLESCHTAQIGNYVVEGHVPEEVIAELLEERPEITGIALAGMPSGSPGMPGKKQGAFDVFSFIEDSVSKIFVSL